MTGDPARPGVDAGRGRRGVDTSHARPHLNYGRISDHDVLPGAGCQLRQRPVQIVEDDPRPAIFALDDMHLKWLFVHESANVCVCFECKHLPIENLLQLPISQKIAQQMIQEHLISF